MKRTVGVTDARSRLGEIIDKVQYQGDTVVLEKNGKPAAVIVSLDLFEKLRRLRDSEFQVVKEVQEQNKDLEMGEDELLEFVNETIHEVRAKTKQANP